MKEYQKGFTLVEIAIVMVIIGLLLGGALKGQEMIKNARIKRMYSDIEQYRAALYTFQDIYRGLPGDLNKKKSEQFFGAGAPHAASAAANNGKISNGLFCDKAEDETCIAWQHLRLAGLIAGDASQTGLDARPQHPFGGFYSGIATGIWGDGLTTQKLGVNDLSGEIGLRLDAAYDDGDGTTGDILCVTGVWSKDGHCSWNSESASQRMVVTM